MFASCFGFSFHGPHGFHIHFEGPFWRRFYTKEERIAQLEKYKEQLEKELEGVKEEIERLKRSEG